MRDIFTLKPLRILLHLLKKGLNTILIKSFNPFFIGAMEININTHNIIEILVSQSLFKQTINMNIKKILFIVEHLCKR
ncbi:MAG: hypothetical protein ACFWUJ_18290 [Pseudomonas fragi]